MESNYNYNNIDYNGERKPKKNNAMAGRVINVIICVILSGVMGFLGGYLGRGDGNTVILDNGTPHPSAKPKPSATFDGSVFTQGQSANIDPKTVAQVAAEVSDSVVEITTETVIMGDLLQQYVAQGAGSGVIFRSDGYIVTNNHVIDGASKINVTLKDGTVCAATLIGADPQTDLAVIKVEATELDVAQFGDSASLIVGQTAIAIGNPLGSLGGTVTDGIISALDREITIDKQTMTLLQISAAVNPGNSGGGLFDAKGMLIGIVNAKRKGSDIEGLGFAIPIDTVKVIITDLVNYGYVRGRVDAGITLIQIDDAITAMQYRVPYYGVYVYKIEQDSNAYAAGVRSGDYISAVNGKQITTSAEFNNLLRSMQIGDEITFAVKRSKTDMQFTFELTEYAPGNFDK